MGVTRLPSITPYLTVRDARSALDFYARAFGGETVALEDDGASVSHARVRIGEGIVLLYEEQTGAPDGNGAPATLGGSPVSIRIELVGTASVDEVYARAMSEGASAVAAPTDRPWGRVAQLRDPEGHFWRLAATTEAE